MLRDKFWVRHERYFRNTILRGDGGGGGGGGGGGLYALGVSDLGLCVQGLEVWVV